MEVAKVCAAAAVAEIVSDVPSPAFSSFLVPPH